MLVEVTLRMRSGRVLIVRPDGWHCPSNKIMGDLMNVAFGVHRWPVGDKVAQAAARAAIVLNASVIGEIADDGQV